MVSTDTVHDLGPFLVLFCKAGAKNSVGQFGLVFRHFTDIVQKSGALSDLGIEAEFGSHYSTDISDLTGVLKQVLSVGAAILHTAYHAHEFKIQAVYAQVDTCALAGFQDFFFQLFAHLGHNFLDTGGMYAAVDDQLVQGEPRHLAAHRIESTDEDGIGCVVNHNFYSGRCFEGTYITAFASDDASFHLVVVDRESSNGILYGSLGGSALYSVDNYSLGLFCSIQPGLVHGLVDVGLSLGAGLSLHVLNKHIFGLLGTHAGYSLELAVGLGAKLLGFFHFGFQDCFLGVYLTAL